MQWAPLILFWQFIVGERTVPDTECYVQFLSNPTITFCTAIAAFYLPVAIMLVLYWQISRASKSRVKTGNCEPSGLNKEVGNNLPTPDEDDDEETQGTDWGQDGEASHAAGEVGGREAEDFKSRQGERGPMHSGASGTAEAVRQHAHPPAHAGHKGNPAAQAIDTVTKQPPKRKVAPSREKKVTRTIMAILVALRGDVDALSRHGAPQHFLLQLRPQRVVDHWLLALLHQQHDQPSLLRPLQRHLQKDLQTPAALPVQEHSLR